MDGIFPSDPLAHLRGVQKKRSHGEKCDESFAVRQSKTSLRDPARRTQQCLANASAFNVVTALLWIAAECVHAHKDATAIDFVSLAASNAFSR
jgi:hypothetical protein